MGSRQEFHEFVLEGHAAYIEDLGIQVRRLQRELNRAIDIIDRQSVKIAELQQALNNTTAV